MTAKAYRLSASEIAVLAGIASGLSNAEIAARRCVSVKTVETQRSRALGKLGSHSAADAVVRALARGILVLDQVGPGDGERGAPSIVATGESVQVQVGEDELQRLTGRSAEIIALLVEALDEVDQVQVGQVVIHLSGPRVAVDVTKRVNARARVRGGSGTVGITTQASAP